MCSVNFNALKSVYNPNFGSKEKTDKINFADSFIEELEKQERKDREGSWLKRNMGTTTASIPFGFVIAYEIYAFIKTRKLKKQNLPIAEYKKKVNNYMRNMAISFIVSIPISLSINRYLNSKTDSNYTKLRNEFNKINTNTNAKLADNMLYSGYIGALYNPVSGVIQLNRNVVNDPISGRDITKLLKHELVHAKQYETVARSKDGIRKINYAAMKTIANEVKHNPLAKECFKLIQKDINSNKEKYKNTKIRINAESATVNFKNYVEAINIIISNPKANMYDIPMVIDAEHYQKVIDKKGPLSPKEEAKAKLYYKAMLEYNPVNIFTAFNPFSSYRNNLLEKEAYRENPSFIMRISNMFD